MNNEDRRFMVVQAEFSLRQAELLALFAKMVLTRFRNVDETRRLRTELEQTPDSDEKSAIAKALCALEISDDFGAETIKLTDLLAVQETVHERMAAALKAVRDSLPPPSV